MALAPDRSSLVAGVGQMVQRDPDPAAPRSPIDLCVDTAHIAAEDAGATAAALEALDVVVVPNILGGSYANPARLVAEALGAAGARFDNLPVGGNTPQKAINHWCREIEAGRADSVLLVGAEALATRERTRKAGVRVDWSGGGDFDPPPPEPAPSSPLELQYKLAVPPLVYPLFENALRAHHGRDIETHRKEVGRLLSGMSEIAARNPYAWFPRRREPDEITVPSDDNRMVAFPYTKYMNAVLRVDQAAAVWLVSSERARALGIPSDRWVHWLGGGDAIEDPWLLSERESFHASNGMAHAYASAFAEAHLAVEDVHLFDLYSCFPSAVEMGCDSLGIPLDDPRPLTVTGGLPYAGGPGNDYATHAVASMIPHLRATPGSVGMTTGVGWYFTKHSAGLYGTLPRMELGTPETPVQQEPGEHVALAEEAFGSGRIETYTVVHDREAGREAGIVIGRLEDDRRFLALVEGGEDALAALETDEPIGRTGRVRFDGERNLVTL